MMNEESMNRYTVVKQSDTWCVVESPDNMIAAFTDSEAIDAETAAKEYAEKMNAVHAKKIYNRCSGSIILTRNCLTDLWHWTEALFNKLCYDKCSDIEPDRSATDTLDMVRKTFKRVEDAINSIPSAKDIEKSIHEHKKLMNNRTMNRRA